MGTRLFCDQVCERGFTEPRRTIEEEVLGRMFAFFCGGKQDLEILLDMLLADVLLPTLWAEFLV